MNLYGSILIILQLILLCALAPFSDGRNCYHGRTTTSAHLSRTPRGGGRADEATKHEETAGSSPSSSCTAEAIVLRIRLPNGSIERLAVSDMEHLTLRDALAPLLLQDTVDNVFSVRQPDGSVTTDLSRSLQDLKVQHGSLLTVSTSKSKQSASKNSSNRPSFALSKQPHRTFDPFPDLAKQNYEVALAKVKRSGARTGGSSYASLANLHQAMHTVEPQPEGRLFRIYMCAKSAARFQSNCLTVVSSSSKKKKKKKSQQQSSVIERRCALLLGTIQKERRKPRVARTSLSSTTDEEQFGQSAKVHAVWEPPGTHNGDCLQTIPDNVLRVAKALGLQPVGWIFSYDGTREPERSDADDGLPVWAADVRTGAQLQAANMKRAQAADRSKKSSSSDEYNDSGALFVTLAMDASTGATEAFQLSDVAVQMVAEDLLVVGGAEDAKSASGGAGRYCTTRNPVLVDGRETRELDSVLCLVNTALLSHEGLYAGASSSSSTKKKTGTLTSKARKAILKELNNVNNNKERSSSSSSSSSQEQLLETLCDFQILLALDDLLNPSESEQLCQIIRKYARGQKRTTTVDEPLRQRIRRLLE